MTAITLVAVIHYLTDQQNLAFILRLLFNGQLTEKNIVLFCVRGSTTGRMNWANQSYAIGRGLAAIHHKKDSNFNWFIKAMVDNSLNDILAAATGSTFPNVGKELLNGFHVIIPDEITLQKYGPQGSAIFRMITDNAKEIDSLYALKKTLLFKLTT